MIFITNIAPSALWKVWQDFEFVVVWSSSKIEACEKRYTQLALEKGVAIKFYFFLYIIHSKHPSSYNNNIIIIVN